MGTHKRVEDSAKVWVTLVTKLSYVSGLIVLDYSLKQVKSKYPLVALYTDDFPAEGHAALDKRGIYKRRIESLNPTIDKDYGDDPRFKDVWTKCAIFCLTEYERVILLDSDMLVVQNMDELMDCELDPPSLDGKGKKVYAAAHACVCNPAKKPHYPKDWVPKECGYTAMHSDVENAQKQGAPNTLSHGMLNSGLVVTNPCMGAYNQILEQLQDAEAVKAYIFPDQELFRAAFPGRWVTLPYVYNALKTIRPDDVHGTIWRDKYVKNVHYIWDPKPWFEKPEDATDEVHKWWHKINAKRVEDESGKGIKDGY